MTAAAFAKARDAGFRAVVGGARFFAATALINTRFICLLVRRFLRHEQFPLAEQPLPKSYPWNGKVQGPPMETTSFCKQNLLCRTLIKISGFIGFSFGYPNE